MTFISLRTLEGARGNVDEDSAGVDTIMRSLVRLVLWAAQALNVPAIYLCDV